MSFHIVIPARYASGRLPGKPLREIAGKPMIAHVIDNALQSDAERIIVATDDPRIMEACTDFAVECCMTSEQHNSGTERVHEVIEKFALPDGTIIVNMQGDEPLMPGACLNQVGHALARDSEAEMATLSTPAESVEELFDWNVIKLVCDHQDNALYFSRAPIPWDREAFQSPAPTLDDFSDFQRHIGLYAYRAGFIKQYIEWGSCALERIESLEQLRVLYHGRKIKVVRAAQVPGPGVNTEEELKRVEKILLAQQ
ncbi:3-deoxy-manno-octulosonate cytidylyltransferase [Thiohalophilus thiocyanatoxydans]|uniref:3-deoxy-manno-octulosonate cytidylyltransferase n=1 Tax=Thiohalophilus thiocyanatoxydans TaxID=381308 RepID=A0A4R8ILB6_9GAMM|nr:3-deoxy-manno-octulosonate cytidylyltransferase [Thiohalophilus thiocyanatoxydans]TDY01582.1 3-deoxy-manno-octulosonate cytidylyltransferase (CMP-KDO synthetase) [Thiohalophilus thiocyanatoxydans]